jgi:hypothetical protein
MAFAEDSSSSFEGRLNAMTERAWGAQHQTITRNVALPNHAYGSASDAWMDRASQVRDGGGN